MNALTESSTNRNRCHSLSVLVAFDGVLSVSEAFVLPVMPLTRPAAHYSSFANVNANGVNTNCAPVGVVMSMVDASERVSTGTTFDPLKGPNSPLRYNNNAQVKLELSGGLTPALKRERIWKSSLGENFVMSN